MRQSDSIAALAAALAAAQAEIGNAAKNAVNPHFRSNYADLAEIINTTRPVLSRHGLAVAQFPGFEDGIATVESVLMHSSGEWMAGTSSAPVTKSDPQGVGSATTYLRRYSLAAICGIAQEDDDGNAASAPRKQATPEPEREPEMATGGQIDLLTKMMQSHVFTDAERKKVATLVAKGITKLDAIDHIDRVQKELKARKDIEKAEREEAAEAVA
jgi:hypothetical protein